MPRPNETTHHQTLPLGSDPELRHRFMMLDEPLQGNLRFGLLMEILDRVAEETALNYVQRYHPDARVVTAAIDDIFVRHVANVPRINFFQPVRIGDTLHFTSRVVYTSGSFICVEASIERTSHDHTTKALSNSCFFTFVNVDSELAHQPVPEIYPASYAEDARYLAAHRSFRSLVEHHAIM